MVLSREAISIVAPVLRHRALDLVESAVARRRDGGDVVPDIAAVDVDRIVVDADVGGECAADDVGAVRQIDGELAVRIAPGAVDVESDDGQLFLLRRFFERAAAGAIVFDFVVQVLELFLGAIERDLVAQLRRGFGERFCRRRLDLEHA